MPGRFSVPPRRPRSCSPPSSGASRSPGAIQSTPAPRGPPNFWAVRATRSAPSSRTSSGASCRPPGPRRRRAARPPGGPARASSATRQDHPGLVVGAHGAGQRHVRPERCPEGVHVHQPAPVHRDDGDGRALLARRGPGRGTQGCSTAVTTSRRRPAGAAPRTPRMARAADSVAPEVKTISAAPRPERGGHVARAPGRAGRARRGRPRGRSWGCRRRAGRAPPRRRPRGARG